MNPAQLVQNRSTIIIFRDCLKLAGRIVTQKNKIITIRQLLRKEFQKHKEIFDQDQIKALKMNAVKGISNYIIHTVQVQYNLNKKKEVNIMDEAQNARAQGEDDLQDLHLQQSNQNQAKFDQVK